MRDRIAEAARRVRRSGKWPRRWCTWWPTWLDTLVGPKRARGALTSFFESVAGSPGGDLEGMVELGRKGPRSGVLRKKR